MTLYAGTGFQDIMGMTGVCFGPSELRVQHWKRIRKYQVLAASDCARERISTALEEP